MAEPYSQFGDVFEHVWNRRWYMEFCWRQGSARFGLARRGIEVAPWWGKDLVVSVRYRPDPDPGDGSNPYANGVLTVFYKRRRDQHLGPWLQRSKRLEPGEYFRL